MNDGRWRLPIGWQILALFVPLLSLSRYFFFYLVVNFARRYCLCVCGRLWVLVVFHRHRLSHCCLFWHIVGSRLLMWAQRQCHLCIALTETTESSKFCDLSDDYLRVYFLRQYL